MDISANGVSVLSADKTSVASYSRANGTSFASPIVAGVMGLEASCGFKGPAVYNHIYDSADDLGVAGNDTSFGSGRLDAYGASTRHAGC